jgi:hypothetical protein
MKKTFEELMASRALVLSPVIPATQEAEITRIKVRSQTR